MDITELSAGISILAGGSRDAKVRSAFKMYDTDGNGFISPQEMYTYLLSVYRVLFETQPQVRESMNGVTPEELAKVTTEEAFAQVCSSLTHLTFNKKRNSTRKDLTT